MVNPTADQPLTLIKKVAHTRYLLLFLLLRPSWSYVSPPWTTVKVDTISTQFRTFPMEVVAGEPNTEVNMIWYDLFFCFISFVSYVQYLFSRL